MPDDTFSTDPKVLINHPWNRACSKYGDSLPSSLDKSEKTPADMKRALAANHAEALEKAIAGAKETLAAEGTPTDNNALAKTMLEKKCPPLLKAWDKIWDNSGKAKSIEKDFGGLDSTPSSSLSDALKGTKTAPIAKPAEKPSSLKGFFKP